MRYRFAIILVLGLCCLGMGRSKLPLTVRFYVQTNQGDTAAFNQPITLLNGEQSYIEAVPRIAEKDIAAVYPFPVADGSGGCGFKLDEHGAVMLDGLSVEKKGTLLIETINDRQVADVLIDQRVTNGVVSIPNGITVDEMKLILKHYPVLGGKKKPKKKDVLQHGNVRRGANA